ncbi:MAG: sensor domain-containing diguanylate cyclase [Alphaproteobacteria bacterium]|nr:sensor domain-containing diguanylate cyclase [Alphaproteobacteria bacterium]
MIMELKTEDEEGRQRALDRYEVLDTQEEKPFETVVNLVQNTLNVPMCAVSLIDRDRQWFKARRGLGVRETPRDISFCTHAIKHGEPLVVNDATQHPTFKDNPLVTGDPHIRAYLGIPLMTPDGYNVGSLCAIDDKPREFPAHEVNILASFAKIVIDQLELRQIAASDPLTGCLSRRAWVEKAEEEIKRAHRYDRALSVAIMDIDRFKNVNDTYGHPEGDKVIKLLAEVAEAEIRDQDGFGRYGGEEFVCLMPETALNEAESVAERIRHAFSDRETETAKGDTLSCTVSVGVAELTDFETLDSVLTRADAALYEAKNGGRNCVVCNGTTNADVKVEA